MAANTATWTATASDGSALVVTLTGKPCVDPGGLSQPASAVVTNDGTERTGTPVQVTAAAPSSAPNGPPVDVE